MRWPCTIVVMLGACGNGHLGATDTSIDAPGGSSTAPTSDAAGSGADETCGCHGQAGCAVWSNVYISWYGFNDNSCANENKHGCNDIAYPAPQVTAGQFGTPYPKAGNITHTQATEGQRHLRRSDHRSRRRPTPIPERRRRTTRVTGSRHPAA